MWKVLCKIKQILMSRLLMRVTLASHFKGKPTLNLFLSLEWMLIPSVVSLQGQSLNHHNWIQISQQHTLCVKSGMESQTGQIKTPKCLKSGKSSPSLWWSNKCFNNFNKTVLSESEKHCVYTLGLQATKWRLKLREKKSPASQESFWMRVNSSLFHSPLSE